MKFSQEIQSMLSTQRKLPFPLFSSLAFILFGAFAYAQTADSQMVPGMEQMDQVTKAAPMTGDPDNDFVAMMIPHHQGAINMAKSELRFGKDPALIQMAKDMITAQNKEIAEMRAWLASRQGQ